MLRLLALFTLLLTAADHVTTWLCLRAPVPGFEVVEANPLAEWLFEHAGLLPGLAIDSALTLGAVGFLLTTTLFGSRAKTFLFAVIALTTGYAVVNNLKAIAVLGIASGSI